MKQFDVEVVLSDIYDAFKEDIEKQEREREMAKRNKMAVLKLRNKKKTNVMVTNEEHDIAKKKDQSCVKFLEKIVNLNVNDAIAKGKKNYSQ